MNFTITEFPQFSFGSIYCIGRNYVKHAQEMNSRIPSEPVVFLKPRSSIVRNQASVIIPPFTSNVHHEVEMVVLIGKVSKNLTSAIALNSILGFGVGIDFTARDLQSYAKKNGLPWSIAKGFDTFTAVGNLQPYKENTDLQHLSLSLSVNSEIRQSDNTLNMIFPVAELISYLSHRFTLFPGDLIFTGTPSGVSQIHEGDHIKCKLQEDVSSLSVHVTV